MFKKDFCFLLLLMFSFTAVQINSQDYKSGFPVLKGKYLGQKSPINKPELFAPGIISTELHDDGPPLFSPDGSEVYFRMAGKPQSLIFKMTNENGVWSKPIVDPISSKYKFQFSAFTHDGKKRFFAAKINPDGTDKKDHDIFYIEKEENGWSTPIKLNNNINTEYDEYLFCIGKDGTIYFGADYPSGKGKMDIYCSKFVNGSFSKPENLSVINTEHVETVASISHNNNFMVFTSTRPPATGGINLWVSYKSDSGKWKEPISLGNKINSDSVDKFSGISPDGKYMFWVSHRKSENKNPKKVWDIEGLEFPKVNFEGGDIYWISTEKIKEIGNIK